MTTAVSSARRTRSRQAGFGLLDVLLAVFLIATVVVALILLVSSLLKAGGKQRSTTETTNYAVNVVEKIEAMGYHPCQAGQTMATFKSSQTPNSPDDDNYWDQTGDLAPTAPGFVATIESIEFLVDRSPGTSEATFTSTCPTAGDQGVQRMVIKVATHKRGGAASRIMLTKRDATCSAEVLTDASEIDDSPDAPNGVAEC